MNIEMLTRHSVRGTMLGVTWEVGFIVIIIYLINEWFNYLIKSLWSLSVSFLWYLLMGHWRLQSKQTDSFQLYQRFYFNDRIFAKNISHISHWITICMQMTIKCPCIRAKCTVWPILTCLFCSQGNQIFNLNCCGTDFSIFLTTFLLTCSFGKSSITSCIFC